MLLDAAGISSGGVSSTTPDLPVRLTQLRQSPARRLRDHPSPARLLAGRGLDGRLHGRRPLQELASETRAAAPVVDGYTVEVIAFVRHVDAERCYVCVCVLEAS
jgi:hypothetical protein